MRDHRIAWIVLAICLPLGGRGVAEPTDEVEKAFGLRMECRADQARELLEGHVAAHPGDARSLYELSRARLYLFDFEGMQDAIGRAVACEPDNASYHHFAALAAAYALIDAAHHEDEDRMRACAAQIFSELETCVKLDPDLHEARCLLVQQSVDTAPEMGIEVDGVEEHVRLLERKDPVMGAKARSNLLDAGRKRALWEGILSEHGDDVRACCEAGTAFIELGDLERANECIDRAIALDRDRGYLLLRLGIAHGMKGEWDRAGMATERYLHLDPPRPLKAWAMATLGRIKQRAGDGTEGKELIDKALAMDPHLWKTFMPPPEILFTKP